MREEVEALKHMHKLQLTTQQQEFEISMRIQQQLREEVCCFVHFRDWQTRYWHETGNQKHQEHHCWEPVSWRACRESKALCGGGGVTSGKYGCSTVAEFVKFSVYHS
jgi:hypothetical protein